MNQRFDAGWDALRETLFECYPFTKERRQIAAQAVLWMGSGILMQALSSAIDSSSMIYVHIDDRHCNDH